MFEIATFETTTNRFMLDSIPFNVSIIYPDQMTRENIWSQRQNAYLKYAKETDPDKILFFIDSRDITWEVVKEI